MGFGAQGEDHAQSAAFHVYYEPMFRRICLKRTEFKRVIGQLFKKVSLLPASNLRMIMYLAQKEAFFLAALLFNTYA